MLEEVEKLDPPLNLKKVRQKVISDYTGKQLAKSIYLWDLEAPGHWCEVYWFGSQREIESLESSLMRMRSDVGGDYIHQRDLSDLSQQEKVELWESNLRA